MRFRTMAGGYVYGEQGNTPVGLFKKTGFSKTLRVFPALVALAMLASPDVVVGQDGATDGDAPAADQAATPDFHGLDEIVVTAQKRKQSIKEVPISISAISGEELRETNLADMNDLSKSTPTLKIQADGIFNYIAIRGLGSGINAGFDQSVGIFIDEIYYASPYRLTAAMFDLERVEILRGPQGTLFGRNTIAGAISLYTGSVVHEWDGYVDVSFGENDWNRHTGIINIPIVEDYLATRLGGQYYKRGGHVYDRLLQSPNGTVTRESYRGKFRYTPHDNLDFVFTIQLQDSESLGQGDQYHHIPDQWLPAFQAFDPKTEGNLDDYAHSTNFYSGGTAKVWDYILHVNTEFWDHSWVMITGYSDQQSTGGLDADFGPIPMIDGRGGSKVEQANLELRLVSEPGRWEYVAGLYGFWQDKLSHSTTLSSPFLNNRTLEDFVFPEVAAAIIGQVLPEFDLNSSSSRKSVFQQETWSYAAYGQLTWNMRKDLSLMAGARIAADEKDLHFVAEHYTAGGQQRGPALTQELLLGAEEFDVTDTREDFSFTPKLSAIYRWDEDVNLYATVARGFKAGGFNAAANNVQNELQFEPEVSTTFELGAKGDYFGNRLKLNVGLFRTEFEDLQVSVFNGLSFVVDNAAEAITQGVEVDGVALLPWGFMLAGSAAYLDATYESFEGGPCQTEFSSSSNNDEDDDDRCDLSGERLALTPEYQTTLSLNYTNPLGNMPFDLIAGVDYYWQDDVFFSTDQDPDDFQEAYYLLNGRIGLKDDDDVWNFMVFFRNIMNETVMTSSADVPLFSGTHFAGVEAPRTITAHFQVKF